MYLQYYRLLHIELKNTRKKFVKLKLEHNYVGTMPVPVDSPLITPIVRAEPKVSAEVAVPKEPE